MKVYEKEGKGNFQQNKFAEEMIQLGPQIKQALDLIVHFDM
jgi:hypothetical protein